MSAIAAASLDAATRDAYRRWAPLYPPVAHNPLMRAEQQAMMDCWPQVSNGRALDLACGTGRYAHRLNTEAGEVFAVDFCEPMLAQVAARNRVCASMMQLPFADGAFDMVICGLAVGHATGIHPWMAEIARVLADRGVLLYSDFHPAAARAGLLRSFKDQHDRTCTVPHSIFDVTSQLEAAAAANLTIEKAQEVRVGFELAERFPGSEPFYRRWHGLPIVLVVRARK
jgi:malonyl-CoA O-methyltransferase